MQYESENPLSGVTFGYFPRQSLLNLKYVGRLLLHTEDVCTWRQIPAKGIRLNILEESFCLFHEHVKYYFAHLNSSVSLNSCLREKFRIHIWFSIKSTARFIYWSSWDKKKLNFIDQCFYCLNHRKLKMYCVNEMHVSYSSKAQWLLCVAPSLTVNNSAFCRHSVLMCFVWIWEETTIISLYSINWLVFITESESVIARYELNAKICYKLNSVYTVLPSKHSIHPKNSVSALCITLPTYLPPTLYLHCRTLFLACSPPLPDGRSGTAGKSPHPQNIMCIFCQYMAGSFYSYSSRVFRGFVSQPLVVLSLQGPILYINVTLICKAVVCVPQKVTCRELLDPASGLPPPPSQPSSCNRTDLVNSSPTGTASNRRKTPSSSEELLARETNNRL
jgi:hypothetical protein